MADKMVECHATSSFSIEGEHVQSGTNLEVPESIYKELRTAQRVEPGHVGVPQTAPEAESKPSKGKATA